MFVGFSNLVFIEWPSARSELPPRDAYALFQISSILDEARECADSWPIPTQVLFCLLQILVIDFFLVGLSVAM